jgi:predicted component of type VI protein secretion system
MGIYPAQGTVCGHRRAPICPRNAPSLSDLQHSGVLLLKSGTELTPNLVELLQHRDLRLTLSASLEIVGGGEIGREVPISGPVKIGRSQSCDLRPNSRLVSGIHCVIDKLPLSVHIKDLRSTNGTFVNDVRLRRPRELDDGDLVRMGDMVLEVHIFAALEGTDEYVERVAGLILADADGNREEPSMEVTLQTSESESEELRAAIKRTWEAELRERSNSPAE